MGRQYTTGFEMQIALRGTIVELPEEYRSAVSLLLAQIQEREGWITQAGQRITSAEDDIRRDNAYIEEQGKAIHALEEAVMAMARGGRNASLLELFEELPRASKGDDE